MPHQPCNITSDLAFQILVGQPWHLQFGLMCQSTTARGQHSTYTSGSMQEGELWVLWDIHRVCCSLDLRPGTCVLKPTCCSKDARIVAPLQRKGGKVSSSDYPADPNEGGEAVNDARMCARKLIALACDGALRIIAASASVCKHTSETRADRRTIAASLQKEIQCMINRQMLHRSNLLYTKIHALPQGHGGILITGSPDCSITTWKVLTQNL